MNYVFLIYTADLASRLQPVFWSAFAIFTFISMFWYTFPGCLVPRPRWLVLVSFTMMGLAILSVFLPSMTAVYAMIAADVATQLLGKF